MKNSDHFKNRSLYFYHRKIRNRKIEFSIAKFELSILKIDLYIFIVGKIRREATLLKLIYNNIKINRANNAKFGFSILKSIPIFLCQKSQNKILNWKNKNLSNAVRVKNKSRKQNSDFPFWKSIPIFLRQKRILNYEKNTNRSNPARA